MAWMFIYFISMYFRDRVIGSIDDTLVLARNESSQPILDRDSIRNHFADTELVLLRDELVENSARKYLQVTSTTQQVRNNFTNSY